MRKFLISLLALSTIASFALGTAAQAHSKHHRGTPAASVSSTAASADFLWKYAGAAPAFKSRVAAIAARREAFKVLGFSSEDIETLIKATDGPSGQVLIVKNDRFDGMLSRHNGRLVNHPNTVADFQKILGGQPDEVGGLFLRAEYWPDITLQDGRKVTLYLPIICRNWADIIVQAPPPPIAEEGCAYESAFVDRGDNVLAGDAMPNDGPPSNCWAQKKPGESDYETDFHWDCTDRCTLDKPDHDVGDLPIYGRTRESFTATRSGWYVRRIPLWATKAEAHHYSLYCDDRADGLNSYGKAIDSTNYGQYNGKVSAFIVYQPEQRPAAWTPLDNVEQAPLVWHFQRAR